MQSSFPTYFLITPEPMNYGATATASSVASTSLALPTAKGNRGTVNANDASRTAAAQDTDPSFQRFLDALEAALASGITLVQLRSKLLAPTAFAMLSRQVALRCHQAGARVIANGAMHAWDRVSEIGNQTTPHVTSDPIRYDEHDYQALQAEIDDLHADGLHLSSAHLMRCVRRPLRDGQWVSAACHTLPQLQHAAALKLDFVTLSPVLKTETHPDATPLGWQRFADMARAVNIPIFALGGMQMAHVSLAQAHGAHGIAAIRSLWAAGSASR